MPTGTKRQKPTPPPAALARYSVAWAPRVQPIPLHRRYPLAAPKRPSKQQAAAIQTACHSDFPKPCPRVHPGTRTAWSCLQANAVSLSSPLASRIRGGEHGARRQGSCNNEAQAQFLKATSNEGHAPREAFYMLRTSCAGDFQKYCPQVPLAGGRAIAWLGAHVFGPLLVRYHRVAKAPWAYPH